MNENRPQPSPYYHKQPMRFKDYEIYYNRDYSLTQIVPNKHNYYEFYFLISGDVTYFIDNRKYRLLPGDVILISPEQNHYAHIDATTDNPYERYVLWLNPAYLEKLSSTKSNLSTIFQNTRISSAQIRLPSAAYTVLHNLLEKIFINSSSKKYGADLLANAGVIELLVNLAQFKLFYTNTEVEPAILLDSSPVSNTHICDPLTVNDICSYFYVSRSHLSAKFRQELGMSIHQYIIKKKLFLAKQDLSDSMSIQGVVEKYSFGNYSSFYRAFKSEFGQSPQKYKTSGTAFDR